MKGGRTPRWAKSPDDVQEYITKAHAQCTSANSILRSGGSIHIGIIDSACRLPPHLTNRHTINGGDDHSFIDDDEDDTTRHGTAVFRRISAFAPEAKVSLYQAVRDDRKLPIEAYSGAVTQAIKDDVDILNLSAGVPWRHPVHLNPLVMETNRLINAGITVVAAAGNHFPGRYDERPPVHCPSAAKDVISVGGLVVKCPRDPGHESASEPEGPYYWLTHDPGFRAEVSPDIGVYCGELGCVGGTDCADHRQPQPWDLNPLPTDDKPDVLAPMHIIRRRETSTEHGWEYLATGTSFSAPLVTGTLASIFDQLRDDGDGIPRPREVRQAVRTGAKEFDADLGPRYDAEGVLKELRSV